ncbi:MAG TPA: hypothetical protein VGD26_03100 [Chitinophagaceae bacterium]
MTARIIISNTISWLLGIIVYAIGVLNLFLVHFVPGIVFLILSFAIFPPINDELRKRFGFSIPVVLRIVLGILIIWFTLGISDLGDMID